MTIEPFTVTEVLIAGSWYEVQYFHFKNHYSVTSDKGDGSGPIREELIIDPYGEPVSFHADLIRDDEGWIEGPITSIQAVKYGTRGTDVADPALTPAPADRRK